MTPRIGMVIAANIALGGCAHLYIDGAPASASIAYDRTEGYLGPRFENGSVPPVVAKISSNGLLLGRDVRQYYATGAAASLLVGSKHKASKPALEGDAKPMSKTVADSSLGLTQFFATAAAAGDLRKARADYVSAMAVTNVDPPDRTRRLRGHQVYVCGLAG